MITQLVRHFWQRGVLTLDDAEYLVRAGFVREQDLPGFTLPPEDARKRGLVPDFGTAPHFDGPLELLEESLRRQAAPRRSRAEGRGPGKRPVLQPEDLCGLLQREFGRRWAKLKWIVRLGSARPGRSTWDSALSQLRGQGAAACRSSLASGLRAGTLKLGEVWTAVDTEPFHRLLDPSEARGRTANAFLALLMARDAGSLGKYAWILKYAEIHAVSNLRWVRNQLFSVLDQLYALDRRSLTRCLEESTTPVATWALVLLHNSYRLGKRRASRGDYGPIDWPPDAEALSCAWTAALEMNRPMVSRLFDACCGRTRPAHVAGTNGAEHPLYCPKGWHLSQAGRMES